MLDVLLHDIIMLIRMLLMHYNHGIMILLISLTHYCIIMMILLILFRFTDVLEGEAAERDVIIHNVVDTYDIYERWN